MASQDLPEGLKPVAPGSKKMIRHCTAFTFNEKPFVRQSTIEYEVRLGEPVLDEADNVGPGLIAELGQLMIVNPIDYLVHPIGPNQLGAEAYKYCGLEGWMVEVINGCTLNSFLTWLARAIREDNGKAFTHLVRKDKMYRAIKVICTHVKAYGNAFQTHYVTLAWLNCTLGKEIMEERYQPIDARGLERYSIIQHLDKHSSVYVITECECGVQVHKTPYLTVKGRNGLKALQDVLDSKHGSYDRLARCRDCKESRVFTQIRPIKHHWVLYINCEDMENEKWKRIPLTLSLDGNGYRLGYASYQIRRQAPVMGHLYSVHRIDADFYIYDSMVSPYLYKSDLNRRAEENNDRHELAGLLYYRL